MHFNKIGVLGAQEIGSMLAVNEKIKKLNLQYNNIGEGASHIAKRSGDEQDIEFILTLATTRSKMMVQN